MERPDFKNDRIAQAGLWTWLVLWTASMVMDWFNILPRWQNPLTVISFCVVFLTALYALIKSYREGYRRFALVMVLVIAILIALAAFILWGMLKAPDTNG